MRQRMVWPEMRLERAGDAETLRRQIARQITEAIREGRLPAGARLPSSRLLAKVLEVSRGTVVEAYGVLLENGLIVTTAGSATRVAPGAANVPNFSNLRRTVAAAHYPAGVVGFEDSDGTGLYLNLGR